MDKSIKIIRHWNDKNQTTGSLLILNSKGQPIFGSLCIERGDRNNQKRVSRIPSGKYKIVLEWSPRFKMNLWEIKGVPNRSECKIHPSNYWKQLNGCIAPGVKLKDINKDGYYDVTSSKNTTAEFHRAMGTQKTAWIVIIDET